MTGENVDEQRTKPSKSLDLDQAVIVLLSVVVSGLTSTATATFKRRHGLGATEWRVLAALGTEEKLSGARIAQRVGLDTGIVSRILKAFGQRGIVQIGKSGRHGNYQVIQLTPTGLRLHNQALATALERETLFLDGLDSDQRVQLVGMLRHLLTRIEGLAALE